MKRVLPHLSALALYVGLAILLTWPTTRYFTTAVPGNAFDSWQNMWNMWWLRTALLERSNPYFTPMLYYPQGTSLLLHTLNPINFLISLPVYALVDLVSAYNFAILANLSLNGLMGYFLALDVVEDRRAALVGGTVFATSGYLLAQVLGGHLNLLAIWPLPLAILLLRRAYRQPSRTSIILAGFALAFTLLADWQYFLFALLWAAWYALWLLISMGKMPRLRPLFPIIAAVGLSLLLASPLIIATAQVAAATPNVETQGGQDFRREQSVDLADLLIPSQLHPLWGGMAEQFQAYKAETHIQNKTAYLGLVACLLALIGLRGRESRFWWLTGALFTLLALGPVLQVAGWQTGLPLPSQLLFELPLVNIFRYPMRFIALAILALAILAAYGAQRLLAQRGYWATALIVLLLVLDNLTLPFPMAGVYIPDVYAELAAEPGNAAVLESPFYYATSPFYMLYQVVHEKPLVGGYTSRRMPYAILDELPLLRTFAYAQPAPDILDEDLRQLAPSILSYFNIGYLNLHSAGGALQYNELEPLASAAAAGAAPRISDASFIASDARRASGLRRSFTLGDQPPAGAVLTYRIATPADPLPFLGIGPGWSAPETLDDQTVRWITQDRASLLIYSAQPRRVALQIDLVAEHAGRIRLMLGAETLISQELVAGSQPIRVVLDLPAGRNEVVVEVQDAGRVRASRVGML
ncbi:hypothetical protein OSCT_2099 [Oscillochloris trichoides DG-6]|uniref:YfhO family protein n=1 Tax=Oscillochloris trichoides DG-6 TaxID=765420 RepID=E1IFJ8_9CHLR|nr:hypothetical protein [Oscillochloris trichoides]EFO80014.1 hypothetical protein OSCT_2099 [Oscillochloris trichoides DG-6]